MANCTNCERPLLVSESCVDHPDTQCGECENPDCDLFRVTLPLNELWAMTPETVASYARMNALRRERIARMYGVQA